MLLRALLVTSDRTLGERVREALAESRVAILESLPGDHLLDQIADGSLDTPEELAGLDVVVTTADALPAGPEAALARIRSLPERPAIIVLDDATGRNLAPGESKVERDARLLSAGVLAVVLYDVAKDAFARALGEQIERARGARTHRARRSRGPLVKLSDLSSKSPAMQKALQLAARVAGADASLLLLGETGSGKEWLARAIHREGPRAHGPFVAVNPSALPEPLLESELFGHEKGAFTGATRARRGAFELAHTGTLFLDEIGDMPLHLQIKLLRVLEEREVQRLGSERSCDVDVRVIAATNQDLDQLLAQKRFRDDLYYRLSVVRVLIPPLRERSEDIPEIVAAAIERFSAQRGHKTMSSEALAAMESYSWPGNVRELINVVERAGLLAEGDFITLDELPEELAPGRSHRTQAVSSEWFDLPLGEARARWNADFERAYLERLLQVCRGNLGQTATRAGIDARTLYNKLRAYGLRKEDFKNQPKEEPRSGAAENRKRDS